MAVSAKRMRDALCGNYGFRTSFTVKVLLGAARQRKMKVLFLPSGMSRREKNQSRYDKKLVDLFFLLLVILIVFMNNLFYFMLSLLFFGRVGLYSLVLVFVLLVLV